MGFGLNITDNTLKEPDKKDWVDYEGIMMPKNTARAKKAWETMRTKKKEKVYDRDKKNKVRNILIKHIKNIDVKTPKILTLESPGYLFVSQLPEAQFFIIEKDLNTYLEMKKNKPNNVFLHHGDLSDILKIQDNFDIIYLDFCNTLDSNIELITNLLPKLHNAEYLGFTFCLRKNKKISDSHYLYDLEKKLNKLLLMDYKFEYGDSYKDVHSPPMVTILLKNQYGKLSKNTLIHKYKSCSKCGKTFSFDDFKKQMKNIHLLEKKYMKIIDKDLTYFNDDIGDKRILTCWKKRTNCWQCSGSCNGSKMEKWYISALNKQKGE